MMQCSVNVRFKFKPPIGNGFNSDHVSQEPMKLRVIEAPCHSLHQSRYSTLFHTVLHLSGVSQVLLQATHYQKGEFPRD